MGILLNKIKFDDIDSSEYGVYISQEGAYNAPTRRGETVQIPARNGDIFLDENAYDNIEVSYKGLLADYTRESFADRLMRFRSALTAKIGYQRLEDTYNPDEYRLAIYQSGLEVEANRQNNVGDFTMIFNCKPQRFLKEGDTAVVLSSQGSVFNPTNFEALPIIKVTGNGVVAFSSAEKTYSFTVTDNPSVITIDSEFAESYIYGGELHNLTDNNDKMIVDSMLMPIQIANGLDYFESMNSHVSFTNNEIPKLPAGEVNVGFESTIDSVELIPRWWRL